MRSTGAVGFTLLEVLVAVAIVAIALVTFMGLHLHSLDDTIRAQDLTTARYLGQTQTLSNIDCHLPRGNGELAARGMVSDLSGDRRWELSVSATDVPMAELVRFARHAKKDIPADLTATGDVDAAFTYRTLATPATVTTPRTLPARSTRRCRGGGAAVPPTRCPCAAGTSSAGPVG